MAENKITTATSEEYIQKGSTLLSAAFLKNPTITYLLSSISPADRKAYYPTYFHVLVKSAVLNGAAVDEISNWESCGILLPPGCHIGNPLTLVQAGWLGVLLKLGPRSIKKMGSELSLANKACQLKAIPECQPFYYVFFLGTNEEARGKGLCSKILRHYQDVAREKGCPVWLEAADVYCRGIYERVGFRIVGEILVGKGVCGTDGVLKESGEGVSVWGMVWWPEGVEAEMKK